MYINLHTHIAARKGIEILNIDIRQDEILIPEHYYSLGIHPWWINETNIEQVLNFIESKMNDENCLAIGEIGLDKVVETDFTLQKNVFIRQLKLAEKYGKPVIIHAVRTHDDILKILREVKFSLPVIFHGFNRNVEMAQRITASGAYLSLGSDLLREQSNAANVLLQTDISRIFFENDDKQTDIEQIYQAAGKIINWKTNDLCARIEDNFKKVFSK